MATLSGTLALTVGNQSPSDAPWALGRDQTPRWMLLAGVASADAAVWNVVSAVVSTVPSS
jgi:hypothetical protein